MSPQARSTDRLRTRSLGPVAIARLAARIRAATATPAPDALILATAVVSLATVAIGNDTGWPGIVERAGLPLKVVLLDQLADA